jgi:predicted small lipoprotein YifL
MSPSLLPAGRTFLIAGFLVLALAACGRRGPPEAPPDPSVQAVERQKAALKQRGRGGVGNVPSSRTALEGQTNAPGQAQVDDGGDADDPGTDGALPSLSPTPRSRARTPYVIPKEPFILDPLL